MNVEQLTAIERTLRALDAHAAALATTELPSLFGGIIDRTGAQSQVARTLAVAEQAAALIGTSDLGGDAIAQSRLAVRMLEHPSFDAIALHDLGGRVQGQVAKLASNIELRQAASLSRFREDATSMTPTDWAQLRTMVDDDVEAVATLPRSIEELPPLAQLIQDAADGQVATAQLDGYVQAMLLDTMGAEERIAELARLLSTTPEMLEGSQLHRVASLLHDASIAGRITDADTLALQARRAALGEADAASIADMHLRAGLKILDDDALRATIDTAFTRDASELSPADWRRMSALLSSARAQGIATLPTRAPELKPFEQIADDLSRELYDYDPRVQHFFEQYATGALDDVTLGAQVDALLARPAADLTTPQWRQLAALLGDPRAARLRPIPSTMSGLKGFDELAFHAAYHDTSAVASAQSYFDRYAIGKLSPEELGSQLDQLMSTTASDLSANQWSRIESLLADPRLVGVRRPPSSVSGLKQFHEITNDMANSRYSYDARIQRFFDQYATSSLDDEALGARLDELFARPASELTNEDWRNLSASIADPRAASLRDLPRDIAGAASMREAFTSMANGAEAVDPIAQSYLERYAVARLDATEVGRQVDDLLARRGDQLTRQQWQRLQALTCDPRAGEVRTLPRTIPGLKSFDAIIDDMANARYSFDERIQGYFDRFAVATLDDATLGSNIDDLMARPASSLAQEDWQRLVSYLGDERTRTLRPMPDTISGLKSFEEIANDMAHGEYAYDARIQGYFERAALSKLEPAELGAQLDELLARPASDLTQSQWHQLDALLSDPRTARARSVPTRVPGLKEFSQITSDMANARYGYDPRIQSFFEQYAVRRLDESTLTAQLDELLGRPASDLGSDDWRALAAMINDPRTAALRPMPADISGLKPFEQIATDLSHGTYEFDARIQAYFDRYAVGRLDDDGLRAATTELFGRDPKELTPAEWTRLSALIDDRRASSATSLPSTVSGLKPLDQIARELGRKEYGYDERVAAYFTQWRERNDPEFLAQVDAAIEAVAHGAATAEQRAMVTTKWEHLDKLVQGRSSEQKLALAAAMLDQNDHASSTGVKSTLQQIRENLGNGESLDGPLAQLHAQTVELVDLNLARLGGSTPEGAIRGYSRHPDYAEIGRIRANLQLIDQLERGATSAVGELDATPAATGGMADSVRTGDTLTW